MKRLGLLAALVLTVVGCGGTPSSRPATPAATASVVVTDSPSSSSPASQAASMPVCQDRTPPSWVTSATSPKDGVPDPGGRIAFGVAKVQEPQGQIVSPLFAMDADGSDLTQLLDCVVSRPRFSPDGTQLAFGILVSDGSWQIATTAADGGDLRILTDGPGNAQTPDWSPDGSWLVYARSEHKDVVDAGGTETLWRMRADGSDQRLLGKPDGSDWEPRISPDGLEVLFTRADPADGFRYTPMIRTLATGQERVAKVDTRDLEHPDWSRDGQFIVYNPSPNGAIERVPADDPAATPELLPMSDPAGAYKPAYSPDGSRIVFGCDAAVCVMAADGSKRVVLLAAPGDELNHFAWGVTP